MAVYIIVSMMHGHKNIKSKSISFMCYHITYFSVMLTVACITYCHAKSCEGPLGNCNQVYGLLLPVYLSPRISYCEETATVGNGSATGRNRKCSYCAITHTSQCVLDVSTLLLCCRRRQHVHSAPRTLWKS